MRTAEAMVELSTAQMLVAAISFRRWQHTLGGTSGERVSQRNQDRALRLAEHVDWAASRLPFATKCLPRAMALSWILQARGIGHIVVFAVRPADLRGSDDQLHAWVEVMGRIILGHLPGPWVETLRLGQSPE